MIVPDPVPRSASSLSSKRRVWVTGAGGLLGAYLLREAEKHRDRIDVVALRRPEFDLEDPSAVEKRFTSEQPDAVIHSAALSRTGDCQAQPDLARRINVEATKHLAALGEGIPFLFISTDLVFDGAKGGYREGDAVRPLSVYAETKVEAEQITLRNRRHSVVRLSLNAGVSAIGGRSFNEQIKAAAQAGQVLRLFHDEFRCPLGAAVTARAVWELLLTDRPGLYHLAGAERLSRVEIGELLARRWPDVAVKIQAVSIRDFSGPPRPGDTSLNCDRIQSLLSFPLPGFGQWLEDNPDEPV